MGPGQCQAVLLTEGPVSQAVESWEATNKWVSEGEELLQSSEKEILT